MWVDDQYDLLHGMMLYGIAFCRVKFSGGGVCAWPHIWRPCCLQACASFGLSHCKVMLQDELAWPAGITPAQLQPCLCASSACHARCSKSKLPASSAAWKGIVIKASTNTNTPLPADTHDAPTEISVNHEITNRPYQTCLGSNSAPTPPAHCFVPAPAPGFPGPAPAPSASWPGCAGPAAAFCTTFSASWMELILPSSERGSFWAASSSPPLTFSGRASVGNGTSCFLGLPHWSSSSSNLGEGQQRSRRVWAQHMDGGAHGSVGSEESGLQQSINSAAFPSASCFEQGRRATWSEQQSLLPSSV